jgi:hypothetical protein
MELSSRGIALATAALQLAAANRAARTGRLPLARSVAPRPGRRRAATPARQTTVSSKG